MPGFGFGISIEGADQLEQVGARLKAAGAGGLRRELLRGIRKAAEPLPVDARAGALADLPKSGGLAALVAGSKITTRTRLSGGGVGVRIVATNGYRINNMDKGSFRHPVFGNRHVWVRQAVPPGWFTESIQNDAPEVRTAIAKVVKDVARKIEG